LISIEVYSTTAVDSTYCDEPGMKKVWELRLDFPEPNLGFQRTIKFTLTFGQMEIRAYARNQQGKSTNACFELELKLCFFSKLFLYIYMYMYYFILDRIYFYHYYY